MVDAGGAANGGVDVSANAAETPTCGTLELSPVQVEAIRGILTAENALQKSIDAFRARKNTVISEILAAHGCPPTSSISVSNFETGAATWTLPGTKP